ncbi:MAG: T9SS type A sorting domain-containing protein, partial [Bacteroidota bacterium]
SFKIVDIDKNNPNSTTYFDRVTVTGSNGVTTYNATITKYDAVTDPDFLVISGNVAQVNTTSGEADNTPSDATDQRGTVNVSFGTTALTSITIRYDNAPGANSNPASQAIAIGSVSFSSSTLPVNMLSFNGYKQAQDVLLKWSTSQEINTDKFEIERNSGGNWETIGTVAARGNSNTITDYTFTDINPQGNLLLYRLKQIDIDQNFKYSTIVRISSKNTVADLLSYPNPFSSQVNLSISSALNQVVIINIYDAAGKTVRTETSKLFTGSNSINITALDKLSRGIYHIDVRDDAGIILGRSMLMKE